MPNGVFTFGLALRNPRSSLGRAEARQHLPRLLLLPTCALLLISVNVSVWLRLQSELPDSSNRRGCKGSWWDLTLTFTLGIAGK